MLPTLLIAMLVVGRQIAASGICYQDQLYLCYGDSKCLFCDESEMESCNASADACTSAYDTASNACTVAADECAANCHSLTDCEACIVDLGACYAPLIDILCDCQGASLCGMDCSMTSTSATASSTADSGAMTSTSPPTSPTSTPPSCGLQDSYIAGTSCTVTLNQQCLGNGGILEQGETATYNGCGSEGGAFYNRLLINPLLHAFAPQFAGCCNEHDVCFGTCSGGDDTAFDVCNLRFDSCMGQLCQDLGILGYLLTPLTCDDEQTLIIAAVSSSFGCTAYNDAQCTACNCFSCNSDGDATGKLLESRTCGSSDGTSKLAAPFSSGSIECFVYGGDRFLCSTPSVAATAQIICDQNVDIFLSVLSSTENSLPNLPVKSADLDVASLSSICRGTTLSSYIEGSGSFCTEGGSAVEDISLDPSAYDGCSSTSSTRNRRDLTLEHSHASKLSANLFQQRKSIRRQASGNACKDFLDTTASLAPICSVDVSSVCYASAPSSAGSSETVQTFLNSFADLCSDLTRIQSFLNGVCVDRNYVLALPATACVYSSSPSILTKRRAGSIRQPTI